MPGSGSAHIFSATLLVGAVLCAPAPAAAVPPNTTTWSFQAGIPQSPVVTIPFSATPGADSFTCSLDGSAPAPCQPPLITPPLLPGQHRFSVAATLAGETDPTPSVRDFCVCATIPGSDNPGISINNGAKFTNDPKVEITAEPMEGPWRIFTGDVVLSNDGGFRPSARRTLSPTAAWQLDSSGRERLPKTVYLRFVVWQGIPVTGPEGGWFDCCVERVMTDPRYTDDIILDETDPVIESARFAGGGASASQAAASAGGAVVVSARDRISGVKAAQLSRKRTGGTKGLVELEGNRARYRGKRPRFARVRDGAGNFSSWVRIR